MSSTVGYNPRLEDHQCIQVYVWRPAKFDNAFFKHFFNLVAAKFSATYIQEFDRVAHFSFAYTCSKRPEPAEWQLHQRFFAFIALFDARAPPADCTAAVQAYRKERNKFKSTLLLEHFIFVDNLADLHKASSDNQSLVPNPKHGKMSITASSTTSRDFGNYPSKFLQPAADIAFSMVERSAADLLEELEKNTSSSSIEPALHRIFQQLTFFRIHLDTFLGNRQDSRPQSPRYNWSTDALPDLRTCLLFSVPLPSPSPKDLLKGRQRKQLGDLCMFTSTVDDAIASYSLAAELLRTAADPVWQAAAVEGRVAAAFVKRCPLYGCISWHDRIRASQAFLGEPDSEGGDGSVVVAGADYAALSLFPERNVNQFAELKPRDSSASSFKKRSSIVSLKSRSSMSKRRKRKKVEEATHRAADDSWALVETFRKSVIEGYQRQSGGVPGARVAWSEALVKSAFLIEALGYERVWTRKCVVQAHRQISETKELPGHVKGRAELGAAHILFNTNYFRLGAYFLYSAAANSYLKDSSSANPLVGLRYIHKILPVYLAQMEFGPDLPEATGGWCSLHCFFLRNCLIKGAVKIARTSSDKRCGRRHEFWYRCYLLNSYHQFLSREETGRQMALIKENVAICPPKQAPIYVGSNIAPLPPVKFTHVPQVEHFSIVVHPAHVAPVERRTRQIESHQYYQTSYKHETDVNRWPKGETQYLQLVVRNPLKVAIEVQIDFKWDFSVDGKAGIEVTPLDLKFESGERLDLRVPVTPIAEGEVMFTGYDLTFVDYTCFVPFRKVFTHDVYEELALSAEVIEEMPLVQTTREDEEIQGRLDLTVYRGQRTKNTQLRMRCLSQMGPGCFHSTIIGQSEYVEIRCPAPLTNQEREGVIDLVLHSDPDDEVNQPFTETYPVTLRYYGSEGSRFERKHSFDICVTWLPLLSVRDVLITPSTKEECFGVVLRLRNHSGSCDVTVANVGEELEVGRDERVKRVRRFPRRVAAVQGQGDSRAWLKALLHILKLQWRLQEGEEGTVPVCSKISLLPHWNTLMTQSPFHFKLRLKGKSSSDRLVGSVHEILDLTLTVTSRDPAVTPGDPDMTPGDPDMAPDDPDMAPGDPAVTPGDPAVTPGDPTVTPGEVMLKVKVHDLCEFMPCSHAASGVQFCVVLGADYRQLHLGEGANSWSEDISLLPVFKGDFSVLFYVQLCRAGSVTQEFVSPAFPLTVR